MMNFLQCHDPRLAQRSKEVPVELITSPEIQTIIDELFVIARGERQDLGLPVMVGLAAPQVGITKRIILVDVVVDHTRSNLGELRVYINPVIVWASEEMEKGREGCYSVDSHLGGVVMRSKQIQVEAYDRMGNFFTEKLEGFTARIFQHECDHLEGIEFPDRMKLADPLHWIEPSEYPEYRKRWETWDKHCPRQVWKAMKAGEPYEIPKF